MGLRRSYCSDGCGVDQVVDVGGPGMLACSIAAGWLGKHISLFGVPIGIAGEFRPLY